MSSLNKSTLSQQIYQLLRQQIISQEIPCGAHLTLKFLQEKFNVSTTPIREALNRLYQDQLIEYYSNVGIKVVSLGRKDIVEIYDFYKELDCLAVRIAMSQPDTTQLLVGLQNALQKGAACIAQNDLDGYRVISDEFHLCFYRCVDNSRILDAVNNLKCQFSILATIYQSYIQNQSVVHSEHMAICQAVENGNQEQAIELMRNHMEHGKNYLLSRVDSIEPV